MATLVRFIGLRRLVGNAPSCREDACRHGRACKGKCTCVARVICGHGPDCDGACEGGTVDGDLLGFQKFDDRCHRIVRAVLGGWILLLAIAAGALLQVISS